MFRTAPLLILLVCSFCVIGFDGSRVQEARNLGGDSRLPSVVSKDGTRFLERYEPETITYEKGGVRIIYERAVPLDTALLFHKFLSEHYSRDPVPDIYRMPLADNLFLVSALAPGRRGNILRRFYLFSKRGSQLVELYRGPGWEVNWVLWPTFFIGKDRVLIIAEKGTEEFGGLEVFEFKKGRLRYLAALPVAKKQTDRILGEEIVSPLSDATAEFAHGTYCIAMKGDLYLFNDHRVREVVSPGSVRFCFNGKSFQPFPFRRR